MVNSIAILGSTGSIGTQALDVARKLNLKIDALTARGNIDLLEKQIREFNPKYVAVTDESKANDLKIAVADTNTKVLSGEESLIFIAENAEDLVLNSLVGMVGLLPTITAIKAGHNIALANKETLVAGGQLVMTLAKEKGVKILPVDSEHSAIFQCLQGRYRKENLEKVILTASGGPFFGKTYDDLKLVKKEDALKHPNWSMGAKITIDSATMMNKGLELIEAVWLFDVPPEKVDIVIHRESIIHSLIEYTDNSQIAQLGLPDMRIPIQYAITYPDRFESPVKKLNLSDISKLTFYKPDYETFKTINSARKAITKGGTLPAMLNGANEEAVGLFLKDKISFTDILDIAEEIAETFDGVKDYTLEDVLDWDKKGREFVRSKLL
jgi:1-deoxy-D-xylulose-5-phosphate reductoisomerase